MTTTTVIAADVQPAPRDGVRRATVVVIGGGQAGLSAAYHLRRRGFAAPAAAPSGTLPAGTGYADTRSASEKTFVVLDADDGPGGAWRHRWRSLRMSTVNGIFDLPGMPKPLVSLDEPSADAVPRYFAGYEREFRLPVLRPVRVTAVRRAAGGILADDNLDDGLIIETQAAGTWRAAAIINATGTWTAPNIPCYPGRETFLGRQLHVAEYVSADEFRNRHVIVVGGGISAVQLLDEISRVTTTTWFTRREPTWLDGDFQPETTGRAVVARVQADVGKGLPPGSIVSYTGLTWTPYARAAKARGALERHPIFTAVEPRGVRLADGGFQPADVILWATGFRAAFGHLEPLRIRNELGGITMNGTAVAGEPRVHLIGYGPSQSTVGANRAGRDAVRAITRTLDHQAG
jgi:cation diffusion facilitator CzcD-associated flavoprotein CzcO